MKKHNVILIIIMLVLVIQFSGCIGEQIDEKDKFIGLWRSKEVNIGMYFLEDNTVTISGTEPFGNIEFGIFEYYIANKQITITSGDQEVSLDYQFESDTELILTNQRGESLTLIKQN